METVIYRCSAEENNGPCKSECNTTVNTPKPRSIMKSLTCLTNKANFKCCDNAAIYNRLQTVSQTDSWCDRLPEFPTVKTKLAEFRVFGRYNSHFYICLH